MDILSYFARNPRAADSLEGIARWRLLDEVVRRKVNETYEALQWLVKEELLLETAASGAPIYRLNPARSAETESTLERLSADGGVAHGSEMPSLIIDSMSAAAPWSAFAPDGFTPSAEISLAVDSLRPRPNADPSAGHITATANSLSHTLRRNVGPLDLTNFDELRLWIYSNRPADGTPARPFFLELRFASGALSFGNPANTWQRFLPVSQARVWEPLRLGLGDLPAGIRSGVTQIQLRSVLAGSSFDCYLDDILAVLDRMIGDVDIALLAQLDKTLVLAGAAVTAVLHPANGPLKQARPYFEITNYDVVYCRERTDSVRLRGDFKDTGYTLRQGSNAFELYYQVTAVADDRDTQAQMLEFALRTLPVRGELVVNGFGIPMESIEVYAFDRLGGSRTDAVPLFYRVSTRQAVGPSEPASPVKAVILDGDLQPPA
jgi:hypothetical protein